MNPICLFARPVRGRWVVVEFRVSPCDLWIGLHWEPEQAATVYYVCLVPMLALRISVWR